MFDILDIVAIGEKLPQFAGTPNTPKRISFQERLKPQLLLRGSNNDKKVVKELLTYHIIRGEWSYFNTRFFGPLDWGLMEKVAFPLTKDGQTLQGDTVINVSRPDMTVTCRFN